MVKLEKTEIEFQLQLGEDSNWEFKQIKFRGDRPVEPKADAIADELAAYANTSGGVVLFGVTDSGNVQDMTREQLTKLEKLIANICYDKITPEIDFTTSRQQIDDKKILAVIVHSGYAAHQSPGGIYRRFGSTKRKLKSDQILRLAQQRAQSRFLWFDKQIVSDASFGILDETLWEPLLSAKGLANVQLSLRKAGLLSLDEANQFRPTVAGILLCSQHPEQWLPNAAITATFYEGANRASGQIDSKNITGPLNRQVADAVAFVVRNMRVGARKDPARINLPQYSTKAIFEAIVNAVIHRDYSIKSRRIRVSMFSDRLEIQSPGSLPNGLTVENMSVSQATRNEALTSVFGTIPVEEIQGSEGRRFLVERRGDGVPIIEDETRQLCGKLPEFRVIDESEVLLVIPAASSEQSAGNVVVAVYSSGIPLKSVDLLLLYPNYTWKQASTDENGVANVELHSTHLPMTVFAAKKGYAAFIEYEWVPAERPLTINMQELPNGGSKIFTDQIGFLPGLNGRLNPSIDKLGKTSLIAPNIEINQGMEQPVRIAFDREILLRDSNGYELWGKFITIIGKASLIEYRQS